MLTIFRSDKWGCAVLLVQWQKPMPACKKNCDCKTFKMNNKNDSIASETQESLLYSARHGELSVVKALLDAKNEGKLTLDINCKGTYILFPYALLSTIMSTI